MALKDEYEIRGLFYEKKGYKFRKYLNIIHKNTKPSEPDLLVIMMNPGSSQPTTGDGNTDTDTKPDNTQTQIMHIMQNCKFGYARVLNLSDYREPKSKVFYSMLEKFKTEEIPHSIFGKGREEDFKELFVKNVPVLFAWGVHKKLKDLAELAIAKMELDKTIGKNKDNLPYAFYHPLPRNNEKQKEWVAEITKLF